MKYMAATELGYLFTKLSFGLKVYDMTYQFLGMEAKNYNMYKFGMFCQQHEQCHPTVAPGDADIRPRNASRIHTCHLFMLYLQWSKLNQKSCQSCCLESQITQLAMRRRATSSRRWHQSPRSRSHTQRRADVGSRSQASQSATLTLQRGLGQWTQSVLASSLDRRQGDPRQMAEIRKLRVNLQLLKSK